LLELQLPPNGALLKDVEAPEQITVNPLIPEGIAFVVIVLVV
jgi:hypothetical protein